MNIRSSTEISKDIEYRGRIEIINKHKNGKKFDEYLKEMIVFKNKNEVHK